METNYNIGLDIGTNSVGWAVTNNSDDILKYNVHDKNNCKKVIKKRMWGSLLYDEGQSAKNRRIFRGTRRRLNRRRERINILNHLFDEEMCKVDSIFFRRLEESSLWVDDRKFNKSIGLLNNDKNYFDKYKTIYHLRNELCQSNEKHDIRLIYLAIHHIIKYRGNFLYENQKFNLNNINLKNQFEELFNSINEFNYTFNNFENIDYSMIKSYVVDKDISKKQKFESIIHCLEYDIDKKDLVKNVVNLIVGLQGNLSKIIDLSDIDEDNQKKLSKIKFSDSSYINEEDNIMSILGDNAYILQLIKNIYTSFFLISLFGEVDSPSISKVMIKKYDKHKEDLKKLKCAIKEYDKKHNTFKYDEFFRDKKLGKNYETYIRNTNKFDYDSLKKEIKLLIQDTSLEAKITNDLEKDNFLLKINVVDNSLLPYQLNEDELEKIINHQKEFYPFLGEIVNVEGKSVYKLVRLLTFRIPYYVGPIVSGNSHSDFAWLQTKSNERINPFNFEEVVDLNSSAENFIKRMTNFCSYLPKEKVMPKYSLLYSEFMVLNEIKQIKVNDKFLSHDVRVKVYNDLFKNNVKKVTDKDLRSLLFEIGEITDKNVIITGYQQDNAFANNLKSYNEFKKIFSDIDSYDRNKMVEKLIEWITIYEDKKILKSRINSEYPQLSDDQVKKICSLKYTGWSRLSRELLTSSEIGYVINDEYKNIIQLMRDTSENFMQIINNPAYKINDQIIDYNNDSKKKDIDYDDIKEIQCSPAVKKDIWQSVLLVKEIEKLMGCKPNHIFVEMARNEDEKKRSINRVKMVQDLYSKIEDDVNEYNSQDYEIMKQLKKEDKIDSERLLLYYLQHGKCMYCCKPLDINELSLYEVDHIIPRSLYKDDSIDNKALVHKICNQRKSDGTIGEDIQKNQKGWWLYLESHNFINSKKYRSLTLREFDNETISGFINRQLVETRQIIKNVANLFNSCYGKDCVCCVRANLSHNFREKNEMYKYRDLNNLHHAHDAYLTASLGNYLLKKNFGSVIYTDYRKDYQNKSNMTQDKLYGYVIDKMDDEKNKQIVQYLYYNDPIVVKKTEIQTGQFYNQTIYGRNTSGNLIELKKGLDVKKYGGYTSEAKSYFDLIEYSKGKIRQKKIVAVPLRFSMNDEKNILSYFESQGYSNPIILKDRIGKNQLIEFKGQKFFMSSDSEIANAIEFHFTVSEQKEYRTLLNYIFNGVIPKDKDGNELSCDFDKIDELIKLVLSKMKSCYSGYESEYNKINETINLIGLDKIDNDDKVKILKQLFIIMKANSCNGNLILLNDLQSKYKFNNAVGRHNLQSITSGKIIFTSLTGLKSNIIEIGK